MKSQLVIDQIRAIEWGLTLSEALLFSYLIILDINERKVRFNERFYFEANKEYLIKKVPLSTMKIDTMYRLLKSLQKKGLIDYLKEGKTDLVSVLDKGKKWNS